jgi:hypothetical protein
MRSGCRLQPSSALPTGIGWSGRQPNDGAHGHAKRATPLNDKPVFDPSLVFLPSASERRAAVRLAAERRKEERRIQFEQLTAPSRAVVERVAIWERLFQIPLPDAEDHPLVRVVLAHTGLTADDIRGEQRRRRELRRQQ